MSCIHAAIRRKTMRILPCLGLLVPLALGAAACGDDDDASGGLVVSCDVVASAGADDSLHLCSDYTLPNEATQAKSLAAS